MNAELALELIKLITLYCSLQSPGVATELREYGDWGGDQVRSSTCFKKIWKCSHNNDSDIASSQIPFELSKCITKHVEGKLK